MPDIRLTNTLTRAKEAFVPIDPDRVRMYACGPTVYGRIHVGNARPLVVFDVLFRLLRHAYGEAGVVYVRNITDIEDKIIARAAAEGVAVEDLTAATARTFAEDAAALGCLPPTHEPRATEHVPGMLELIAALIDRGHAYAAEGHVLFHVPSMPDYGRLSRLNRDETVAGARVEVAPYKRDPADFVLWKPAAAGEPGWDAPFGRGRPGWHLECSAMAEALLAPLPFDIHAGGQDLIFPHHENEIAQSRCAGGLPEMARVWLHNGFVDMAGQKMSKSLGNVLRMDEALAAAPGEAVRLFLLTAHYRQPLDFTEEGLLEAKRALDRFYMALARAGAGPPDAAGPDEELLAALADDLNTPLALARLHALLGELNKAKFKDAPGAAARLKAAGAPLGLLGAEPEAWLKGAAAAGKAGAGEGAASDPGRVDALVAERVAARRAKDFARADAIRRELADAGVIIEDGPSGSTWRRA